MNIERIKKALESYINGYSDEFDWNVLDEECKYQKAYYGNLVERLVKYYLLYKQDELGIDSFLLALRGFLLSFKTDLFIDETDWLVGNEFGLALNGENNVYASLSLPDYISSKFVAEAFQMEDVRTVNKDKKYCLQTNSFIRELTGHDTFASEAQKLCVLGALKAPFGYSSLVVLPTGGGKSLVTQCLAYQEEGLTLVIVPTISLAIDQEISAKESIQRITNREIFSYSSGSTNGQDIISAIKNQTARLLFISPEAIIKNDDFSDAIFEANKKKYLKNIIIDEAHIVVEWGDFFRTDYQILEPWRKKLLAINPLIRTFLLSATINANTEYLLKRMFSIDDKWIELRCDSLRTEPRFCVVKCKSYAEKKHRLIELVKCLPHPLIIYTLKPDRAEKIKEWFVDIGYKNIKTFTGETKTKERDELIRGWKNNEFDVMVATSAFGMGVDKPDVRTVIHEFVPDNPNMFYQELGRGGRDHLPCLSVLCIYPDEDLEIGNRSKVLKVDTALGRWSSMYMSPKSSRVEEFVYIDTKIKPTYNLNYVYDEASARDIQWNIYLLLLLRRYGLIDISDMEYEKNEDRYIIKARILDERLSVIDDRTEDLLEEIRNREKHKFKKEFEVIKESIVQSEHICISDMFIKTYPRVAEYCAGCSCHNKIMYDDDERFVLNKRVGIIEPNSALEEYGTEMVVFCKSLPNIVKSLIGRGIRAFVCDEDIVKMIDSEIPELVTMSFYEFRRVRGSKNDYFTDGLYAVLYSDDEELFNKQFSIITRYANGDNRVIHVVNRDFEIFSKYKTISACVGNNISDYIMEEENV